MATFVGGAQEGFGYQPVLLHGGQDTATGLSVPELEAPVGSSLVTPSTTLLTGAISAGISYTTQIAAQLGDGERLNFKAADGLVVWVDGQQIPRSVSAHRKTLPMAACFCGYRPTAIN